MSAEIVNLAAIDAPTEENRDTAPQVAVPGQDRPADDLPFARFDHAVLHGAVDFLTVLTAVPYHNASGTRIEASPMTKVIHCDETGAVQTRSYSKAKWFCATVYPLTGFADWIQVVESLSSYSTIIRGRPLPGVNLNFCRRIKEPQKDGTPPMFEEYPHRWAVFDFDKVPAFDIATGEAFEAMADAERTANFLRSNRMPGEFTAHDVWWQWSSSAGLKADGGIRMHLAAWFDRAIGEPELKRWFKAEIDDGTVDPATFRCVQPNYVAAPVFEGGAVDPVAGRRWGLLKGRTSIVTVPDWGPLDAAIAAKEARQPRAGQPPAAAPSSHDGEPIEYSFVHECLSWLDPAARRAEWFPWISGLGSANFVGMTEVQNEAARERLALGWNSGDLYRFGPSGPPKDAEYRSDADILHALNATGGSIGTIINAARAAGMVPPTRPASELYNPALVAASGNDTASASVETEPAWPLVRNALAHARATFERPHWAWEDRLLAYEPNLITGLPGAGKTTLATNEAVHIAAGIPMFGYPTMPMRVFMLIGEDTDGVIRDNLLRMSQELGLGDSVLSRIDWLSVKSQKVPGGHLLATIDDHGRVENTRFMRECVVPRLQGYDGPVLFIVDPLASFITIDRNKPLPAGALGRVWAEDVCMLNNRQVTVQIDDHPSNAAVEAERYVSGDVQFRGGFSLTATLRGEKPAEADGIIQRKLIYQTLKPRYAAETETVLYRIGSSPLLKSHPAKQLALAANMARVYRHVEERRARGERSFAHDGNGTAGRHGPTMIAVALNLPRDLVQEAIRRLIAANIYFNRKADRNGAHAQRDPGGLMPAALADLFPLRRWDIEMFISIAERGGISLANKEPDLADWI